LQLPVAASLTGTAVVAAVAATASSGMPAGAPSALAAEQVRQAAGLHSGIRPLPGPRPFQQQLRPLAIALVADVDAAASGAAQSLADSSALAQKAAARPRPSSAYFAPFEPC